MRNANLFSYILEIQNIFILLNITSTVKGVMIDNIEDFNLVSIEKSQLKLGKRRKRGNLINS